MLIGGVGGALEDGCDGVRDAGMQWWCRGKVRCRSRRSLQFGRTERGFKKAIVPK
jgi:hypothetical protein